MTRFATRRGKKPMPPPKLRGKKPMTPPPKIRGKNLYPLVKTLEDVLQKNPYSVLQFSSQSSTQKIWYSVLRTDFRWYSVLRDPPPDTLLETYSSPE